MRVFVHLPLLLAAHLTAQVFVVDANGGGQFTDLQAAINAVPDGATLHVRSGNYREFVIQAKSVTILAENVFGPRVELWNPIRIDGLSAGQQVRVSGLKLVAPVPNVLAQVQLTNNAGSILLDRSDSTLAITAIVASQCRDLHLLGLAFPIVPCYSPPPRVDLTDCNVQISDSTIVGFAAWYFETGGVALRALRSTVTLCASQVTGGQGANPGRHSGPGTAAGDSVVAIASTIHVFGAGPFGASTPCAVIGGQGGSSTIPTYAGGDGGHGLVLANNSSARVIGTTLRGGNPGTGMGNQQPGRPSVVDASSRLDERPSASGPSAFLAGTMGQGQPVRFSLRGLPAAPAALLVSPVTAFARPAPLALGALTVGAGIWLGGFAIPASGLLEVTVNVPATWPADTVLLAQFVSYDAGSGELQASNSFTAITR